MYAKCSVKNLTWISTLMLLCIVLLSFFHFCLFSFLSNITITVVQKLRSVKTSILCLIYKFLLFSPHRKPPSLVSYVPFPSLFMLYKEIWYQFCTSCFYTKGRAFHTLCTTFLKNVTMHLRDLSISVYEIFHLFFKVLALFSHNSTHRNCNNRTEFPCALHPVFPKDKLA